MEKSKIGGGLLTASSIAAPVAADMMGLTVSAPVGWTLLGICALLAVIGLAMMFRTSRKESEMADEREKPKGPQGSIGIYMENCSDSSTEGNTFEGIDTPIVDIGGRNNQHRGNVARRSGKPEGS